MIKTIAVTAILGAIASASHAFPYDAFDYIGQLQFSNPDTLYSVVDVVDIDNDGQLEVIAFTRADFDTDAPNGKLFILDEVTQTVKWSVDPGIYTNWTARGLKSVTIMDADGDGDLDILMGLDDAYQGVVVAIDGATKAYVDTYRFSLNTTIITMEHGDVDLDGQEELLVGLEYLRTNSGGIRVMQYDTRMHVYNWFSPMYGPNYGRVDDILIANVDADAAPEIIITAYGATQVYDGVTHQEQFVVFNDARSIGVFDYNKDGIQDLVIGRRDGAYQIYDVGSKASLHLSQICNAGTPVNAVLTLNEKALAFSCDSQLVAAVFDPSYEEWRGPDVTTLQGFDNYFALYEKDGETVLLVGDLDGLQIYQKRPDPNIPPELTITSSPIVGPVYTTDVLSLSATALDLEDGDLTRQIEWYTPALGVFGYGGTVDVSLPAGSHDITISVLDSQGYSTLREIHVEVGVNQVAPSAVSLQVLPSGKIHAGDLVSMSAVQTGGEGDLVYRYTLLHPRKASKNVALTDWTTSSEYLWDTTSTTGSWTVLVEVKNVSVGGVVSTTQSVRVRR